MKSLGNKIDLGALTEEQRQYVIEMYASALNDIDDHRIVSEEPHSPVDVELHTFHNGLNKGTIVTLLGLFGDEPFKQYRKIKSDQK